MQKQLILMHPHIYQEEIILILRRLFFHQLHIRLIYIRIIRFYLVGNIRVRHMNDLHDTFHFLFIGIY